MTDKKTVLIVDDTPDNLALMSGLLKDLYKTKVATSGAKALQIALSDNPPDLILLDIMMPEMDGYQVCHNLKSQISTRDIPIIFLTAKAQVEDEQKGFELGAVDYITKPISPPVVLARVKTHLLLKEAADFLKYQNEILEQKVAERTREIADRQRVEYELRAAKEKMENELNIAAQIQHSVLPADFPDCHGDSTYRLYATMTPAREVGGDFYDFFFLDDETLAVCIADVSDKGVPAALYMMVSRTIIRSLAKQGKSPSAVLAEANDLLCEGNEAQMFVTVFLAYYNICTGRLTYSNGGHNPAILFGPGKICREFDQRHGMVLGIMPGIPYKEDQETIEPGQLLFMYTDGVTEALSPKHEFFGKDRFVEAVYNGLNLDLPDLCGRIKTVLEDFQQGVQFDDITMLTLKRRGDEGSQDPESCLD